MPRFVIPGASDRTVIIGPTGSGKTIMGGWILAQQRMDTRPWVIVDFKGEDLWYDVGFPPIRRLKLGEMPGKRGLYMVTVRPDRVDELEEWFWKVWRKGNIGLIIDEVSLVPQRFAFKAILRQGRSKLIPVIACTQRPVDCDREVFTESQYRVLYGIEDDRDWPTIKGLFKGVDARKPLPRYWSYWYDAKQRLSFTLQPVPPPVKVASMIRKAAPWRLLFGT